jgi:hypothetical protein
MISKSLTGRKRPPFSEEWRKKMGRSRELNQSKTPNNEYKIARQERIAGRPKPSICEICNNTGRICFDHDHKTGNFRGWICTRCNVILGFVNDDANVLVEIIRYLNK